MAEKHPRGRAERKHSAADSGSSTHCICMIRRTEDVGRHEGEKDMREKKTRGVKHQRNENRMIEGRKI